MADVKSEIKEADSLFLSKLFLPFVLMLSLMSIAATALQQSSNLLILSQLNKNITPLFKLTCAFPAMILIIAFVIFLRKVPLESWIFYALISFVVILIVIAIWAIPGIQKPSGNKLSTAIEFVFSGDLGLGLGEVVRQWRLSLTFLVIKFLSPALFSVIVWAFINQVSEFSEAVKYYIPLAFLSALPSFLLFSTRFFSSVTQSSAADHARFLIIGAIISIALAVVIFKWACHRLPIERWLPDKKESSLLQRTSPILSLALALAGFGLIKAFFNVSFKTQMQTLSSPPTDYTLILRNFLKTGAIGSVIIGAICVFAGPWLLKRFGWRKTVFIAPLLVLGSILLFVFGIPFDYSLLTLAKIHEVILMGLRMGLLMPLLQIVYLSVPKEWRFRTKGWAELVVAPIFISIGNGVIGGLDLLRKTATIVPYFGILSILTLVVMSLALYKLSLRRSLNEPFQM